MTLPGNLGRLDFSDWLLGLLAAFIGGGASAVTSGFSLSVIDPKDFNLTTSKFWTVVSTLFIVNGVISAAAFLRQKPVPVYKSVETTVKTTTEVGVPVRTEKTETKVVVEPLPPPSK